MNGHEFRKYTGIRAVDVMVHCINEDSEHDVYSVKVDLHRLNHQVDYGTVTVPAGFDNLSDRYGEARRLAYQLITNERKQ